MNFRLWETLRGKEDLLAKNHRLARKSFGANNMRVI